MQKAESSLLVVRKVSQMNKAINIDWLLSSHGLQTMSSRAACGHGLHG